MTPNRTGPLLALALALPLMAWADPGPAPALPASPAVAAPQAGPAVPAQGAGEAARPARVRASHQVDVIAPGEKVETVIDRMRAIAAVPAPAVERSAAPPSVRSPAGGGADRPGPPPPGVPGTSPRTRLEAAPRERPPSR